ncbi:MAG: ribonuclease R [Kiloniellales bacterium]
MSGRRRKQAAPLPSKQEILEFIRESPKRVGKREIARAFVISSTDRPWLTQMLRELAADGEIERGRTRARHVARRGLLPAVAVVEILGPDPDGELLARPVAWRGEASPPTIYMAPEGRRFPAMGPGERALVRLSPIGPDGYEGKVIRRIADAPRQLLGLYQPGADGGRLRPSDRRHRGDYAVAPEDAAGAEAGELVLAEVGPANRRGPRRARIVERLGRFGEARAVSRIAIHEHDIPTEFTAEALTLAAAAKPVDVCGRVDLRRLPLVTIDGADARDFDDAVWAEPDPDPGNPGGWHLVVAIADVAWYVRPGDAIDQCAYARGNSVYFPDRVVPMLPEALSNDLCSLKPGADRACLAVDLWIDAGGRLKRHRFVRGLMCSAARLRYDQVQRARDGRPDRSTRRLMDQVIAPLYGAYEALARARARRGTLDLEIPERQVVLDPDGRVAGIVPEPRHHSHRLIEEFMIAANVAAAQTLARRRRACMYRVHDAPDPAKIEALRQVLGGLGYRLVKGQGIKPRHFAGILERTDGRSEAALIHQLILRSQAQASYSPDNIGHFGLALGRYAHFTSPIRRYADLLVHRALIAALGLGEGAQPAGAEAQFAEAGLHISLTERRAVAAERAVVDRYLAAFLADRLGAEFSGRISGVTRFGLFVTLDETGADGLVPMRSLADDSYRHDSRRHRLVGRMTGRTYFLGQPVQVRLIEADPVSGGLVLRLLDGGAAPARNRRRPPRR